MKKIQLLAMAVLMIAATACGSKKDNTASQDTTKINGTEQVNGDKPAGPYQVEKGSITYEMETMGMKSTLNLYWKDYGKISCNETIMEMMGVTSTNVVITQDGFVTSYDLTTKTGRKVKVSPQATVDYSNMDSDLMKKMNMKEEGNEEIMGKPCVIYSMDYMGVKSKTWVWNGLALKMESKAAGMPMSMLVKSMNIDNDPPSDKFEIPAGIKIQDATTTKPGV